MSTKQNYLKRLPKDGQARGKVEKGEIEIVTSKKDLRRIESKCADDLSGSALGKGGKRIGILIEDEVHMVVRDPLRYPSGATNCRMRVIGKTEFDGPNGVAVAMTPQAAEETGRSLLAAAEQATNKRGSDPDPS